MNKQEIKELFVDNVKQRAEAIRKYVMDKSNSYEDRLEVFKAAPEHLQHHEGWVVHLPQFEKKYGEIVWYDDFYAERYSKVDLTDVFDYKEWPEEKEREFMEEVLDMGIWSFTYDW